MQAIANFDKSFQIKVGVTIEINIESESIKSNLLTVQIDNNLNFIKYIEEFGKSAGNLLKNIKTLNVSRF